MPMTSRCSPVPLWVMRLGLCLLIHSAPLLPWTPAHFDGMQAHADDDDHDDSDDDDDDDHAPAPKPRVVPGPQLLASGITAAQLQALKREGWRVLSERHNELLQESVTLLQAPAGIRDPRGQLRRRYPQAVIDINTFYRSNQQSASRSGPANQASLPAHFSHIGWTPSMPRCARTARIGLIDTQVNVNHPALKGARIKTITLPERLQRRASLPTHGTAVASVLVGQPPALQGLTPQAELLVVDAFHRTAQGQEHMDAWDLVAAIDALSTRGAQVINMSFAGAANKLLARALRSAHARGIVSVAAVGNRGPAAAPQYPAAYPDVLGVTAVDARNQVFHRAGRGPHVDLAAPGVQLPTAGATTSATSPQARSGTSFAAPLVTAAVAAMLTHKRPAQVTELLYQHTLDLGTPGHDNTYGHGLLQMQRWCQ